MTTDGMDPFNPLRGKQSGSKGKQKSKLSQPVHRAGQISILRQPQGGAPRPVLPATKPARVISMTERLDRQTAQQNYNRLQQQRMSVGLNAYERFQAQQKKMRLAKIRRDILSILISVLLLCSSGYITYQVTSAWFTGRSITLATFVDGSHFSRHFHHKKIKNTKKTAVGVKAHAGEETGKKVATAHDS